MRRSAMARLVVMGVLMLGLMIPLMMVQGVVSERATRRDAAVAEVGGIWGGAQTIRGPVLTPPYRYTWIGDDRRGQRAAARADFPSETLGVARNGQPELRRPRLFQGLGFKTPL